MRLTASDLGAKEKARARDDEDQGNGVKAMVVSSKRGPQTVNRTSTLQLDKKEGCTASKSTRSTVAKGRQAHSRILQTNWKMEIPKDLRPEEWDYIDFMEFCIHHPSSTCGLTLTDSSFR